MSTSAADVKALHDALIRTRLSLRVLVKSVQDGRVYPDTLRMLEDQYCGPECDIDSLETVVRSRKQFDDIAIENAALRAENERLRNHIRVAREERNELLSLKPRPE